MSLQCLVFDCDGVILDSVPVKTRAFSRLMEPFGPEARDRFLLYHKVHGGVSRYKKFEWFYEEVLGKAITAQESEALGNRFAEFVLDELRQCQLIPGIQEALDAWRGKRPMFVCSGAPQEEVVAVLRERGLDGYFNSIHGSPPAKAVLLGQIVAGQKLDPADVLMVGDATTDRDAAETVGTLFYGVGPELRGGAFPWGEDLAGLNAWITAHA